LIDWLMKKHKSNQQPIRWQSFVFALLFTSYCFPQLCPAFVALSLPRSHVPFLSGW
jgi:hypothetical protein